MESIANWSGRSVDFDPLHKWMKPAVKLLVGSLLFILPAVAAAQQSPYELKIGHPRLIMTKYDELALRFILMENPLADKLKSELKKDADVLLNSKNIRYSLDMQKTMLSVSREYLKRILTLSMAYRIFEDEKYSDKAINLMLSVCEYPDWNPQHFLDVAEMTAALAIGYDWNFYHLNIREKEIIRNRIVEYGLKPGLDVYNNPEGKPHVWYKMNNSWNQVCAGGLILGALAVAEDFPDLKNNIVYQAVKNLVPTLDLYQPDGVWHEGPDYWNYANSYLAMTIAGLQSALEHDFGLSNRPGVERTALYYVNSVSPAGYLFNFADAASPDPQLASALFWFSKRFKQKEVSAYYKSILTKNVTPGNAEYCKNRDRLFYLSLPWFDETNSEVPGKPVFQIYDGLVDLMFFNGRDGGGNALYLAAKAGKGTLNYQQLDAGTFVIDADGERWGADLGGENEFLPYFYDCGVDGGRWRYYRNTNKSHSTLVIGDNIQFPNGESKVVEYRGNINQPFGIIDLTEVYQETSRVHRGFKLLNEDQILVRDEVTFKGHPTSLRWGMMTDANIELQGDRAVLSKNGKKFYVQAFGDGDIKFEFEAARSYHKEARDNSGKSLLFVRLNASNPVNQVDISIVLGRNINGLNEVIVKNKLDSW
jgi:hypothetical protein